MIVSLAITVAVLVAVTGFVRWAVSDGAHEDDPWLIKGELHPNSPDAVASRASAMPSAEGLRVIPDGAEPAAAPLHPWPMVAVEEIGPCIVFTGQFGWLICPKTELGGATWLARIDALRGAGDVATEG